MESFFVFAAIKLITAVGFSKGFDINCKSEKCKYLRIAFNIKVIKV